jgi:hypothetical protein
MASIALDHTTAADVRSPGLHRIRAVLRVWRMALRRAKHRRDMVNELRDQRLFADIGVAPPPDGVVSALWPHILRGD